MSSEPFLLSKNNLRRMHGWARAVHPRDWQERCVAVAAYLARIGEDEAAALIQKGWPDVFAAAEQNAGAFAGSTSGPDGQA